MPQNELTQTMDHLFRHQYGSIVAGLTARFGSTHIEFIEDAVQEALYKAMKLWAFKDMPEKPGAWLYRVAHHALIDRLRKERRHYEYSLEEDGMMEESREMRDSRAIQDEQLQMIFACCTPAINEKNSLLLSLKLIGGFSVKEIARALLMGEEAAKKSVQRARADFQKKVQRTRLPEGDEMPLYLDRVLKVIYLIFNEGYKASDGDQLVKDDLCGEALRLSLLLSQKDHCQTSELFSLISLICFKAARFDARIDENGNLVLLKDQDRRSYEPEYIQWGYYYFNKATSLKELTTYYLEAAIEFQYHISEDYSHINWKKVLALHEKIQLTWPTTRGQLNYLIVFGKVYGAGEALGKLQKLEGDLSGDHLYFTYKAELLQDLGRHAEAKDALQQALGLVQNEVERKYLGRRLSEIHDQ